MIRFFSVILRVLIAFFIVLLTPWVSIEFCYWYGNGWCGDVAPVFYVVGGLAIVIGFILFQWIFVKLLKLKPNIKLIIGIIEVVVLVAVLFYLNFANHRHSEFIKVVKSKNVESVEYWLNHGADPNTIAGGLKSVLYLAVQYDSLEVVELLLKNGADPNRAGNCNLYTPLNIAFAVKNKTIINILLSYGSEPLCDRLIQSLITNHNYQKSDFELYFNLFKL